MTKTNAIATKSHHVTPHTTQTKRPAGGTIAGARNNAKRGKYGHHHRNIHLADDKHNKCAPPQPPSQQPMDLDDSVLLFDRLDPSNPVHDHRIKQRRKMITKGKNTAGYDNYLEQVPKSRRKARSLKTPSTPDAALDIPAKRWNGLVRAWRKSLHQYDPQDLVNSLSTSMTLSTATAAIVGGQGDATNSSSSSSNGSSGGGSFSNKTPSTTTTTTAKRTIENMTSATTPSANRGKETDDRFLPDDESSPISLLSAASGCRNLGHDAFGDDDDDSPRNSNKAPPAGVFSTTARKNLVCGATGWGDLDTSDDDDDDLL